MAMGLLHTEREGFSGPVGPSPEQLAVLFSEAAEPAGSDAESLHWSSTWVLFPTETAVDRGLVGLKNKIMN